ncbi:hypothetical protein GCM10025868_38970 [Angustibacter aerolatus]|uniref:3-hydroxyacyl-CoA dehydrogenase n=1 Tax=Angustibacter aerolatus TaxID=1162965 RepID=A0ABQ6JK76_9ACTN|nr:3-hydroxyacyl-CoA dehydrogenase NAD-binding domain-containing protein [Angustibacter aerolatus]GMA88647.1 hypothetical protein GCM10025868_38970 [Angustibacter aerolatus]
MPDALTPAAPQQVGADVRTVGVVGDGPAADAVAQALQGADVDVVRPAGDDLAALAEVDLVLEAGADDVETARAVFARLDAVCRPGAVLATTARTVPVIECAAATERPSDVVGARFVAPTPAGRVVEVVSTVTSSAGAADAVAGLVQRVGAYPVRCPDRAGGVVDALLFPYLNDAVRTVDTGYASADDVDTAMTAGCGYPAGPFAVLDDVGLDVALDVQRRLLAEQREPGLAPSPLLEQARHRRPARTRHRPGFR